MAQQRLGQIGGQLSGRWPQGLLKDEVCVVTGSGNGIGREAALQMAREGGKIVVSDLDAKRAEAVVQEILESGGQAFAFCGDVTDPEFPKKLVAATVEKYGKINHIVNNAGFTYDKMIHTMTDDTFELMLKVHNVAPFRLVRESARYMREKDPSKRENRSIVNVSSTSGLHGNVGQANYAVAKAGIVGLTKTIAKEWGAFGVRANTVAYGYVLTRLTAAKEVGASIEVNGQKIALGIPSGGKAGAGSLPDIPLGRAGTPDEAARGIVFLCSPLAAYVSGHTLEVTGGRGI